MGNFHPRLILDLTRKDSSRRNDLNCVNLYSISFQQKSNFIIIKLLCHLLHFLNLFIYNPENGITKMYNKGNELSKITELSI